MNLVVGKSRPHQKHQRKSNSNGNGSSIGSHFHIGLAESFFFLVGVNLDSHHLKRRRRGNRRKGGGGPFCLGTLRSDRGCQGRKRWSNCESICASNGNKDENKSGNESVHDDGVVYKCIEKERERERERGCIWIIFCAKKKKPARTRHPRVSLEDESVDQRALCERKERHSVAFSITDFLVFVRTHFIVPIK